MFATEADRATADCKKFMQEWERATHHASGVYQKEFRQMEREQRAAVLAMVDAAGKAALANKALADSAVKAAEAEVAAAFKTIQAERALEAERLKQAEAAMTRQRRFAATQGLSAVGGALTAGVTAPLAGIAGFGIKSAMDIQAAMATITQTTGATGRSLDQLGDSFKHVAATVPASFGAVASALALVHQRTGLTGAALENLTRTQLTLARVTKTDVADNVRAAARVFAQWGVSVQDQTRYLDMFYKASQLTGVAVPKLEESLKTFGPQFRALGFSLTDTTAVFTGFEKAGLSVERMGLALSKSLNVMAKGGVTDVKGAFLDLIQRITHARSAQEALTLAVGAFGQNAGVKLVDAIKKGVFNLADLERTLTHSQGAIKAAGEASLTLGQRFEVLQHKTELALQPLGKVLLDDLTKMVEKSGPAVQKLAEMAAAFGALDPKTQAAYVSMGLFAAALGPVLIGIGKLVAAWPKLVAGFELLEATAGGPVGLAIAGATALGVAYATNFANIKTGADGLARDLGKAFKAVNESIRSDAADIALTFQGLWKKVEGVIPHGHGGGADVKFITKPAPGSPVVKSYAADLADQAAASFIAGGLSPNERAAAMGRAMQAGGAIPFRSAGGAPVLPAVTNATQPATTGGKWVPPTHAVHQKLTDLQKEEKAYHEELTRQLSRLTVLRVGESQAMQKQIEENAPYKDLLAQVAGKYHLLSSEQQSALAHAEAWIKAQGKHSELLKQFRAELDKTNQKIREHGQADQEETVKGLMRRYQVTKAQAEALVAARTQVEVNKAADKADEEHTNKLHSISDAIRQQHIEQLKLTNTRLGDQLALEKLNKLYSQLDANERHYINTLVDETRKTERIKTAMEAWTGGLKALEAAQAGYTKQQAGPKGESNPLEVAAVETFKQSYASLPPVLQLVAFGIAGVKDQTEQLKLTQDMAAKSDDAQFKAVLNLSGALSEARARYLELTGATRGQVAGFKEMTKNLDLLDPAIEQLVYDWQDYLKANEKAAKSNAWVEQFAQGTHQAFMHVFDDLYQHGFKRFFKSVIDGFSQMLQQIAAEYLASRLTDVIFGKSNEAGARKGGLIDALGGLVGGLFRGGGGSAITDMSQIVGKAGGGDIMAGKPYWVGEQGRELVVPRSNGTVIPHAALAGAGGTVHNHFNFTIHTPNPQAFRQSQHQIMGDAQAAAEAHRKRRGY